MYCEQCGKLISDDAKFCKYCGAKVSFENRIEDRLEDPYDVNPYRDEPNDYIDDNLNTDDFEDRDVQPRKIHDKRKNSIVWIVVICLLIFAVFYNKPNSSKSSASEDHSITEQKVNLVEYFQPALDTMNEVDLQTNSMNGGYAVNFNHYIYYINADGNICRMNDTMLAQEIVIYGSCQYLCYYGDDLIYTDENFMIHRADLIDKTDTILVNTGSYYLTVSGDTLYYQNDPDGESIYALDLVSGESTQINEEQSYNIMYRDHYIYYSTKTGIYQYDMDNQSVNELLDEEAYAYNIVDDRIYYLSSSDLCIHVYNISDESNQTIVNLNCYEIVCNEKYLCFEAYNNDSYEIGVIDLTSDSYDYKMLNVSGNNLAISDHYLFYSNNSTYFLDLDNLEAMCLDQSTGGQSI